MMATISQWILAVVFLYAGAVKLVDLTAFSESVATFQLLPEWSLFPFAIMLSIVEILLGIMLLAGVWTRLAAFGASLLLLVFTLAILNALLTGTAKECDCFGGSETLDIWSIGRDLILLALSITLLRAEMQTEEKPVYR